MDCECVCYGRLRGTLLINQSPQKVFDTAFGHGRVAAEELPLPPHDHSHFWYFYVCPCTKKKCQNEYMEKQNDINLVVTFLSK